MPIAQINILEGRTDEQKEALIKEHARAEGDTANATRFALSYRPVVRDPLTTEDEGGIALKKIAPKARTF